jgi:DtxR family Mn-dependent transcriptional regulator
VTELIDTTEMYLRTIFELEEDGIVPLRARIAERLGHSGPTVSQTVGRMERDGLLTVVGDRHIELSDAGRLAATRVMRKHRLAERLLVEMLGLEWELAHAEACRWEHVISDHAERRILAVLGDAAESPYGNPIPGLEELLGGAPDTPELREGVRTLTDALEDAGPAGVLVRTRRIGEPVQTDHATLSLLTVSGLVPGHVARVRLQDKEISATPEGVAGAEPVVVPRSVAAHVFVAAVG